METTQFDVNILNLHSLSINSEFMVYMKPRSSRIDKKITTQINIIINTGLFKKIAKISKSFLERDISSKLSKLMMKYSTHDLKIFNAIFKNLKTNHFSCYTPLQIYTKLTRRHGCRIACIPSVLLSVVELLPGLFYPLVVA